MNHKNIFNIPNTITFIRIILSFVLFFLAPFKLAFYIVFAICGVSDMLDGHFARFFNLKTSFGAFLDSVADFVFCLCTTIIIILNLDIDIYVYIWTFIICLIKISSTIISCLRFNQPASIHTIANKVLGLILFISIFLITIINLNIVLIILCSFATFASIEELLIIATTKTLDMDQKSIFKK